MKVYLNGKLVNQEKAVVSVFDHGLLYGDGVFEGIRIYHGRVFKLNEHIERIFNSAKAIALKMPMTQKALCEAVVKTCKANKLNEGYVRLIVTRGEGSLGLNPYLCKKPQIIIIAAAIQLYPKKLYETGMRVVTVPTVRNHVDALNPRIKSLNYLNNVMAKIEAINAGVLECIMLNSQGHVAEASGDNVFVIKGKRITTPPTHSGALEGLTRNTVMKIARERGYEMVEEITTRYDLFIADEVFLTGTAAEIIAVVDIDARKIGRGRPGKITKLLSKEFHELTRHDGTLIE
jgi:branched-chain amino acid aminotransferase